MRLRWDSITLITTSWLAGQCRQWSQSPDWIPPLNHFIEWSTELRCKSDQCQHFETKTSSVFLSLYWFLTWEPGRAWTWCWSWSVGALTSLVRSSQCWPDSPPSGRTRRKEEESGDCWRWTGAPLPLSGSSPRTLHRGERRYHIFTEFQSTTNRTSFRLRGDFFTTKTKMENKDPTFIVYFMSSKYMLYGVFWLSDMKWQKMSDLNSHLLYIEEIQSWNVLW